MVRLFLILFLIISSLYAQRSEDDIYETNCIKCHSKLPVGIDKYFNKYL